MILAKHIHDHLPTWYDAINRHVSMVQLLEHLNIKEPEERGDVIIGKCPLHCGHNPDEFYVYQKWNTWCCYGKCHRGGTPLDFVSLLENVSYPVAALMLQAWFQMDLVSLELADGSEI